MEALDMPELPTVRYPNQHHGSRVAADVHALFARRGRLTIAEVTERFWLKVIKGDGCWLWIGPRSPLGYGVAKIRGKNVGAHRVAYALCIGPIPVDRVLDHICRNPACVNPAHLEPVTNRVNILRGTSLSARHATKTHCKHGHPLDGPNMRVVRARRGSRRLCLTCNERQRATYLAKRAERRRNTRG